MRVVSMINVRVWAKGFIHDKTYGFYIDTASDILIDDCTVTWEISVPIRQQKALGRGMFVI